MTGRQAIGMALFFALFVVSLIVLRGVLLPFVAGFAVAYLLDPLVDRLEKWRWPRTLAALVALIVFFVLVIAALFLFLPIIQAQIAELAVRMTEIAPLIRDWIVGALERLETRLPPDEFARLKANAQGYAGDLLVWVGRMFSNLWSGGMALLNFLSLVLITPLVAFYLLRDWDRLTAWFDGLLPRRHAETIRTQAHLVDRTLAGFVRGQGTVCLVLGAIYAIGLSLIGLQFGFILGLGAGLISFIPFLGSLLGFIAGVGLAFTQFSEWTPIAMVAVLFVAGQILEGNLLTPKLVGSRVGLHPVWVIFALLAGGALFGFLGILLAVPVAATVGVLVRFGIGRYLLSSLYKGAPGGDGSAA